MGEGGSYLWAPGMEQISVQQVWNKYQCHVFFGNLCACAVSCHH